MRRITYDWRGITARARKAAGAYVLAASDVPESALQHVRSRRHPELRRPDGRLLAELRNEAATEDGQVRGDLYVAFVVPEASD